MPEKDTKICKYCKEKIAKKCPKCGGKCGMPIWAKILIIIAIVIICVIGCVSSCSNAVDEALGGYDDQNGKTSFTKGEVFESKYLKITYQSFNLNFTNYDEYSTVKKGYKVVQFKLKAENIGEETQTFDYTDFDCYADNQSMQQFYGTDDSGLDSGGTISQGKTTTTAIYCEVPKKSLEVSIEYKPLLAEKNYIFIAK